MTEVEIYRALALPLTLALMVLSFSKLSWPRRALSALVSAVAGIAVGLVWVWAARVGAPAWTSWAIAAVIIAAVAGWMWLRRRRVSARH